MASAAKNPTTSPKTTALSESSMLLRRSVRKCSARSADRKLAKVGLLGADRVEGEQGHVQG